MTLCHGFDCRIPLGLCLQEKYHTLFRPAIDVMWKQTGSKYLSDITELPNKVLHFYFAVTKDYLALLRHLLQIKCASVLCAWVIAIFSFHQLAARSSSPSSRAASRTSVDALFTPTLLPAATAMMDAAVKHLLPHLDIPAGAAQFSPGLLVNTTSLLGKRSAGSDACTDWCVALWITCRHFSLILTPAGWANTFYFIDPVRGMAVVFGTQLSPPMDDTLVRLEQELYAGDDAN
ncbi:hypothetical protein GGX14DRAFT_389462 [Mycena pura]|uniref:Beta-lactamase-related domain-containing protein n=1 Tax=Mycena pura TaxID=153505 RepID=A0AAD6VWM2_9AGAR|nr:hypothetical protein GGX14DRAFT_389462 [Mycena pura]